MLDDESPTPANLGNDHGYDESPTSANLRNDHEFIIKVLYDESPTSANLGNDRGFIIKEYYLHYWFEAFWESPKQSY